VNKVPNQRRSGLFDHIRAHQIQPGTVVSVPGADDQRIRTYNGGGESPWDGHTKAVIVVDHVEIREHTCGADVRLVGHRPDGTDVDLWVWAASPVRVMTPTAAWVVLATWNAQPATQVEGR
jgi:hypothetical protein